MTFNKVILHPDLKSITLDVLIAGFAERELADGDGNPLLVNVFAGDPTDPAQFPCVGVNLTSDVETGTHIGDEIDDTFDADEQQIYAGISALFTQQVEVKLWSTNADERDFLGRIMKEILFAARGTDANPGSFTTTPGLTLTKISNGFDEGISDTSETYAPHPFWMRTYNLSAQTELTVQEPAGPPITRVDARGEAIDFDIFAQFDSTRPPSP